MFICCTYLRVHCSPQCARIAVQSRSRVQSVKVRNYNSRKKQRWLQYCRMATLCKISVYASVFWPASAKENRHGTINGTTGTTGGISGRQRQRECRRRCRWVLFWCDSITSAWVQPLFKLPLLRSQSQSASQLLSAAANCLRPPIKCAFYLLCTCVPLRVCVCVCAFTTWLLLP